MRLQHRPALGLSKLIVIALTVASLGTGTALAQNGGGFTAPSDPTAPQPITPAPAPAPALAGTASWTAVQKATWYGPGLWGNSTACGQILRPTTLGVANKNLPCGTSVTFTYGTKSVTATVIDRGPYRKGYAWDLTKKVAKRLGFLAAGTGTVTAAVTLPAP